MCKVSICIPTYNNILSVERLLNSIEVQEYRDYEVIITDDSTDNRIGELIGKYEMLPIHYYKNQQKLGATRNWNEAISKSHGEYIKIMHHDDWFTDKNSLQRFVELLDNNPRAILAFSGTVQVESKNSFTRGISDSDVKLIKQDFRNLFLGNTIGAPSAVIHRRTDIKYDEELTWLVDMEFYMHLLENGSTFSYTTDPLISIGISDTQLTESCINNEKINRFEYAYIYNLYKLRSTEYKEKMIDILLHNDGRLRDAKECGISRFQYMGYKVANFFDKAKYKTMILFKRAKVEIHE